MSLAVLATCSLNQWAMDFSGNLARTRASIAKARAKGARYRLGPELEISGFGCEDHFFECDTFMHSWQCIAELIASGDSDDMLLDIGAPVLYRGVPYNCRILILNREILLIRPKVVLANDGNYVEPRWFAKWERSRRMERFALPSYVRDVCYNSQASCPIGIAIVELSDDITVACESCEELWTLRSLHIDLVLAGVHIIGNGSGSHYSVGKQATRLDLIQSSIQKTGGVYLYSNQIGCDGARLYYDGSSSVFANDQLLAIGHQFTVETEVDVVTAVVDLSDVFPFRSMLGSRHSEANASQAARELHRVQPSKPFSILAPSAEQYTLTPSAGIVNKLWSTEEEVARVPACWLWDYLRRSGLNGFFLALSGGADSASTAAIVGSMCQLLVAAATRPSNDEDGPDPDLILLLADIRRVARAPPDYVPRDPRELAGRLMHTLYMGVSGSSSKETRDRALAVANDIGAWHANVDIGMAVDTVLDVFVRLFGEGLRPRFRAHGGSNTENLALQNLQARVRMVLAYLFAQLVLWGRGESGSLLVLGSGNMDESLRGYMTKYDCSSADINPIGGMSKERLRAFLKWASSDNGLGYASLRDVVQATPTAELEPTSGENAQNDEQDMGMTYKELSIFGRLRKMQRCGPVEMFRRLRYMWNDRLSLTEIAQKVKFFFRMYAINRHKLTTLTPSVHVEVYSPADNRLDPRQFLYNSRWTWQFGQVDKEIEKEKMERKEGKKELANRGVNS